MFGKVLNFDSFGGRPRGRAVPSVFLAGGAFVLKIINGEKL